MPLTAQLALWLSLLALLTALSLYESLHDTLPDGVLSLACIGYALAVLGLAATPQAVMHGFAAGGVGFLMGLVGAPLAASPGQRLLHGRAPLCVGLVAGWPTILLVGCGWGLLAFVIASYFVLTDRTRELFTVSFLPFLTLSALIVFAVGAFSLQPAAIRWR